MESNIGQNHADQGHVGYVQTLGYDLSTHQDLNLTGLESAHRFAGIEPAAGRVRVPSLNADPRQQPRNLVHHPLSPDSQLTYVGTAALPALPRDPAPEITPVAHQPWFG